MSSKGFWLGAILIMSVLWTHGQYYSDEFGQNRIQYKDFQWTYYSTGNFDVYYYVGGQDYAKQAIDFLEEEFNRLTDVLGYAPYTKTKIFIYNSVHDLQQSNIGIGGEVFTIGGQTNFIKLQLEVAYPGSMIEFRQDLVYKLSRVLIEDMMFGGSLAEIFQSSYLLSLPKWFIDGAARYLAYGWSAEMDDHIRDYLRHRRVKKLIKIEGDEAGVVGQSIWNYISLIYGRSNISNVLNLTRIIRSEQNGIASTLGVNYKQFLANWQNYYILMDEEVQQNYVKPRKEDIVAKKNNNEFEYKNVRINPSGDKIVYSQNHLGKYYIYVHDRETRKDMKIMTGGYRTQAQKVDTGLPLLDWIDDTKVGVVYYKRGFLYIATYDLETRQKLVKPLRRFKQVKSFSFNENGRLAVISGDVDGQNDIFLVSMRRNALRRITSDSYDDFDPVFIPGTAAVVFSSNRPADTLKIPDQSIREVNDNFNLFLYDLDTTKHEYFRMTNTLSIDRKPIPKNQYEVFYLSDQKGITNLFKYSFIDSTFTQITNFDKSIIDYDLHFDEDGITFLMLDKGVNKVFYDNNVDFRRKIFSAQTARQRFQQARMVADKFVARAEEKAAREEAEEPLVVIDTLVNDLIDPDEYEFEDDNEGLDPGFIDTDNYRFEQEDVSDYQPESFFSNYKKLETKSQILGPIPYEPRFSFSNLITSFAIDPLRNFGILLETQISDMLENHKLTGGALVINDLNSGDFFAEYKYLKYWMDLSVRVDGRIFKIVEDNEDLINQRYAWTSIQLGASLPISNWFRLEINPFYGVSDFKNLQFNSILNNNAGADQAADNRVSYTGVTSRAVFDNTIERGFNILQGTRGQVEFKHMEAISQKQKSFSSLKVDLRHYQKVHREITLATRFFFGHSFGANPQSYLLGGVPNWLFRQIRNHQGTDPLEFSNSRDNSGILFNEFVTNLRGYDYSELFGTNAMLFNAELRFPIFRYFTRGPISSNFFRNFQLIGFYDIGSAWTGKPPFTRENSVNTVTYESEGSPFKGEIANFRNPWLASYGAGLRTVLMSYYVKVDVARPISDFEAKDTRVQVSVGLDF
ncbi:MAG: translocation protein TolB [Cyclobacteriaceae bacterium]|nr:translocation protein TolB [Cyclobacteriaceae bacterium HetDA_MAG_MS6]